MLCKNCGREIVTYNPTPGSQFSEGLEGVYYHVVGGSQTCALYAQPILGHINRHLDAATILAEMEARRPTPAPAKVRQPNMDLVEGTFEGEL